MKDANFTNRTIKNATLNPTIENQKNPLDSSLLTSKNRTAFTMIELVFIIVILGILASIAVPKMAASRDDARKVALTQDVGTITQAVTAYYMSQGEIKKLSDAVTTNTAVWSVVDDYRLDSKYKSADNSISCVTVKLLASDGNTTPSNTIKAEIFRVVIANKDECGKLGLGEKGTGTNYPLKGKGVTWDR